MLLGLVACGGTNGAGQENSAQTSDPAVDSTVTTDPVNTSAFTVADTDEEIYMNAYGDFYEAYQKAMEAKNVSERHALLAVAEAKALEAGGGTPMYGPTVIG